MKDYPVTLATYFAAAEANFVLSNLREAGIPAFLEGEMTASVFAGNYGLGQQIRLLVARSDWKRAADFLSGLEENCRVIVWDEASAEEGYWICPRCDEAVEDAQAVCASCKSPRPGGTDERADRTPAE